MRPGGTLLKGAGLLTGLGLASALVPSVTPVWWAVLALLTLLAIADGIMGAARPRITGERHLKERYALGVAETVTLVVHLPGRLGARVTLLDGSPAEVKTEDMPWVGYLDGGGRASITYPVTFLRRGRVAFGEAEALLSSPLGFWLRRERFAGSSETKVYPNYQSVIRFALLAMEQRERQMGIVRRNLRGVSREFHQLREYQDGDALSQIDWKATSRHRQLVSRDYQEQRNQHVVMLVDNSLRMRALDGELPQFDHCLNAMLLLSYVALRQGDQVGVLTGGEPVRWLPSVKGAPAMNAILNHLYDYETSLQPTDFTEAANLLMTRQRRRAMVVLLTNLRSEDSGDLMPALRLLRTRHLVVTATLREKSLQDRLEKPVVTLQDALELAATHRYFQERRGVIETLQSHGIIAVDAPAQDLPIALANRYLDIKQSGAL